MFIQNACLALVGAAAAVQALPSNTVLADLDSAATAPSAWTRAVKPFGFVERGRQLCSGTDADGKTRYDVSQKTCNMAIIECTGQIRNIPGINRHTEAQTIWDFIESCVDKKLVPSEAWA